MSEHILRVIADDLSPEHLLAAIKHWVAKFEQEIQNNDHGPRHFGEYEFEHDGKPTTVRWDPAVPGERMAEALPVSGAKAEAEAAIDEAIKSTLPPYVPYVADPTATADHAAAEPGSTAADVHAAIAPDAA